jgi:hypothetical protein
MDARVPSTMLVCGGSDRGYGMGRPCTMRRWLSRAMRERMAAAAGAFRPMDIGMRMPGRMDPAWAHRCDMVGVCGPEWGSNAEECKSLNATFRMGQERFPGMPLRMDSIRRKDMAATRCRGSTSSCTGPHRAGQSPADAGRGLQSSSTYLSTTTTRPLTVRSPAAMLTI